MPTRIYPTIAEAKEIHRLLIDEFGGAQGLLDEGRLEAAVLRPQTGYYGSLVEEAAALMESLFNNHPFLDGNKRVSFALTDIFLRLNGFCLKVDPLLAYAFITERIVKGEFHFDRIRDWISTNLQALD